MSAATDVHAWFELTYSNFLVLHRSILQSMPLEWQHRFVAVMGELESAVEVAGVKCAPSYSLVARDDEGRFMKDPIPHYNRGRTRIPGLDPDEDARIAELVKQHSERLATARGEDR